MKFIGQKGQDKWIIDSAKIHPKSWLPVSPKKILAGGKLNTKKLVKEPKKIAHKIKYLLSNAPKFKITNNINRENKRKIDVDKPSIPSIKFMELMVIIKKITEKHILKISLVEIAKMKPAFITKNIATIWKTNFLNGSRLMISSNNPPITRNTDDRTNWISIKLILKINSSFKTR